MSGHHLPAKRLLVFPALLVATILVVVVSVPSLTMRSGDESTAVLDLPPAAALDEDCRRGLDTEPADEPFLTDEQRVSSGLLFSCPTRFDGVIVTYVGELVGDLLRREEGAWALVNDDDYALEVGPLPGHRDHRGTNSGVSVWLPDELLADVTGLGRPGQRGDVVRIEGRVARTDPEDGGGLTLRANQLSVLRPAERFDEPVDVPQAALAGATVVASLLLWAARRRAAAQA